MEKMSVKLGSNWVSTKNGNNQDDFDITDITNTIINTLADLSANGLERWIQRSGKDSDPGSVTHPKYSIASANASILSSPTPPSFGAGGKIDIGPGSYGEIVNILMNVCYVGTEKGASLMGLGLSYQAVPGPGLAVIFNLNFINTPVVIDTSLSPGIIAVYDFITFSSGTTIADPISSANIHNFVCCFFNQGSLTINGGSSTIISMSTIFNPGNSLNVNSNSNQPINVSFPNTTFVGDIFIVYNSGDQPINLNFGAALLIGAITVTGNGVCAPGSVTIIPPLNYTGNITRTGTAGFCVINDNGNSATALIAGNGTDKATLFASPAGSSNQTIMRDNANNLFYDYVRAWYLTVAGGGQASIVNDPSSFVVGNVLQITSLSGPVANVAFQPPTLVRNSTSQDYWLNDDSVSFNVNYTTSGGNDNIIFASFAGVPFTERTFDPFTIFDPQNLFGRMKFNNVSPSVRNVLVEFKSSVRSNIISSDPGLINITIHYNGVGIATILNIRGDWVLFARQFPIYGYAIVQIDFSAGSPELNLHLEISNSDDLPHNISFDQANVRYTVLAQ